MNVRDFQQMKDEGRRISMITCYDYSSARAVADSNIDCILVGDSLAMTMHGFPTTLSQQRMFVNTKNTYSHNSSSSALTIVNLFLKQSVASI